jgi:hypothetical protein
MAALLTFQLRRAGALTFTAGAHDRSGSRITALRQWDSLSLATARKRRLSFAFLG